MHETATRFRRLCTPSIIRSRRYDAGASKGWAGCTIAKQGCHITALRAVAEWKRRVERLLLFFSPFRILKQEAT
jgi:hypothetical protein